MPSTAVSCHPSPCRQARNPTAPARRAPFRSRSTTCTDRPIRNPSCSAVSTAPVRAASARPWRRARCSAAGDGAGGGVLVVDREALATGLPLLSKVACVSAWEAVPPAVVCQLAQSWPCSAVADPATPAPNRARSCPNPLVHPGQSGLSQEVCASSAQNEGRLIACTVIAACGPGSARNPTARLVAGLAAGVGLVARLVPLARALATVQSTCRPCWWRLN
jgi:hypothetical protein